MGWFTFHLTHPWLFAAAAVLSVAAAAVAFARRPAVHATTLVASGIALVLLALAAGGLTWRRPAPGDVVVMVDLSPSTRGATYRDLGTLEARVKALLGDTPHTTLYFADRNTTSVEAGQTLPDMASERTAYTPPAASAVVLFSDARFPMPTFAPPTFVVADPALAQPDDAAVGRIELRGEQLAVTVRNAGRPRRLTLSAVTTQPTATVEPGELTLTRPIASSATIAAARFEAGDRWPENDALSLPVAQPAEDRWWLVTNGVAAPTGWTTLKPQDLPTDPAAYLGPSVIALDNLAAGDLSAVQQRRLEQYVRDLGGSLLIGGGDRAFAQGMYAGSALETLSPLASTPPNPTIHWALLVDASGSMSQAAGDATRWQLATSSVTRLLPNLPPQDPVSVGSFAAELTWWSTGKTAREVASLPLPPTNVTPNGPTNLAAALRRVAAQSAGDLPTELLVVSDADVVIDEPDAIAAALKAKRIRLHVLAIGDGRGLDALGRLTTDTGGTLRRAFDPRRWAAETQQLLAGASPKRLMEAPARVTYQGPVASLPARDIAPWNRTWLKDQAIELARGAFGGEPVPLAGRWAVGSGQVIAMGFSPKPTELETLAKLVARPPRDPRYVVTWHPGARLRVRVDAAEGGRPLNDLKFVLELSPEDAPSRVASHGLEQTAPGSYEAAVTAPRGPSFAAVRLEGRTIDRVPVAGRYAEEFDAVGNDYDAMTTLARRTGGAVVTEATKTPLAIPMPGRVVELDWWLYLAAAVSLTVGLGRWRWG